MLLLLRDNTMPKQPPGYSRRSSSCDLEVAYIRLVAVEMLLAIKHYWERHETGGDKTSQCWADWASLRPNVGTRVKQRLLVLWPFVHPTYNLEQSEWECLCQHDDDGSDCEYKGIVGHQLSFLSVLFPFPIHDRYTIPFFILYCTKLYTIPYQAVYNIILYCSIESVCGCILYASSYYTIPDSNQAPNAYIAPFLSSSLVCRQSRVLWGGCKDWLACMFQIRLLHLSGKWSLLKMWSLLKIWSLLKMWSAA